MPKDPLEIKWSKELGKVEKWARMTVMSGAAFGDEDVRSPRFLSQCKGTTKRKNWIINYDDMEQLQAASLRERIPDGTDYKVGLFVSENSEGEVIVSLEEADFLGIVEEMDNAKETRDKLEDMIHYMVSEGIITADQVEDAAGEAGFPDYVYIGFG